MGNWIEKKLSEVCYISIGGTPSRAVSEYWDQDCQTQNFWVSIKDMNQKVIATTSERISKKGIANSNAKLVKKGTVLLSFKLSIGKVSIAGNDLFTNEAIAALEAFGIDNQFLFHGLHKWDLLQDVDQAVKGATLNKEKLKKIKFTIPENKDEQITIATILTNIDQSIEKTEQLIAKYERIKTGLMQDLLTRGIDEQGNLRSEETHEFKDSVLGRIPQEWEVVNFGSICSSLVPGRDKPKKFGGDIPWITTPDIKGIYTNTSLSNLNLTKDGIKKCGNKIIPPYSLIMTCVGELGICTINQSNVVLNQQLHAFVPDNKSDVHFLFYALTFQKNQMLSIVGYNVVPYLNKANCESIKIAFPSKNEQKRISSKLLPIEDLISSLDKLLLKLKNQKTALMQDLLTGKVRVNALML